MLVATDAADYDAGGTAAAALLAPDETAFDVLRALHCCRGTGLECVDSCLEGGCLGPGELVVLHGEAGSAKSVVLQNILALHIAPTVAGGHALPAVFIDAEGGFDMAVFARLLEGVIARGLHMPPNSGEEPSANGASVSSLVKDALSRMLIFRPEEPIDLLRQICQLRDLFLANPTASLLAVDSISAWQPLTAAFPRALTPVLRETWNALLRLQQEHCLAVVVTQRDSEISSNIHRVTGPLGTKSSCRHLNLSKHVRDAQGGEQQHLDICRNSAEDLLMPAGSTVFEISTHFGTGSADRIGPCGASYFTLSDVGWVSSIAVQ